MDTTPREDGEERSAGSASPEHGHGGPADRPAGHGMAYFDCFAGASGDMLLGALVDAGWSIGALAAVVDDLGLSDEVGVTAEHVMRGPLAATRVRLDVREVDPPRRRLADVRAVLAGSRLPAPVIARAAAVFERLAAVEAAVHGTTVDDVHFHEVGALDAIVDIAGVVAGVHALGVVEVGCSALPLGDGWVSSDHGPLPVPAPATLRLLADAGAPTAAAPPGARTGQTGELVTPTGAALLVELCTFARPAMTLARIGHGAGARERSWPNVLRLWLGAPVATGAVEDVLVVETSIDDMVPEVYGHVMARLFDLGALDVTLAPVHMKKDRPGVTLSVLAPVALEGAVAALLLAETSTLGVRVHPVRRHVAAREVRTVDSAYGPLCVKVKLDGDMVIGYAPEYEDCRRVAVARGAPLTAIYAAAIAAAAARWGAGQPARS